jgi:adenine-specific DNA-methyltransferase
VVNKEFYKEISDLFTQLVGGSVYKGKQKTDYEALLKLPHVQDKSQTSLEFAVRLIGRVIFCWFLREKKSDLGKSLMPNNLLSLEAVKNYPDYYHTILESIFFEVLNKPINSRKDDFIHEPFSSIPYLNGGLFSPQDDDFFSYNLGKQAVNHNTVDIPDEWIRRFFAVLETYNFTIDENTSFDEELSIDPEMLGRIFENLLAEINPETGESARKSSGSYYTPRVIVDYMVDQSLFLYLKDQTHIDDEKLRSVISYDLTDDEQNPLTTNERERIINALDKVKILDPACGSGAFPMGALQKIVFILQQSDSDGQLWFKKQIKNTSPELRRVVER